MEDRNFAVFSVAWAAQSHGHGGKCKGPSSAADGKGAK